MGEAEFDATNCKKQGTTSGGENGSGAFLSAATNGTAPAVGRFRADYFRASHSPGLSPVESPGSGTPGPSAVESALTERNRSMYLKFRGKFRVGFR